ncbi:MAG: ribosome recycling factor [Patescibacteria group bacterium]|jgi:ribosome recycling factor
MQDVLDMVITDIGTIRTGRATPALIEELVVAAYGGTQRLKVNELATITSPDPQTLVIDPWDKSIIGEIKQGILSANIGFNPSIDGEIIRISLPPLTTEDREKYVKLLSTKLESGRVMIRQVRSEAMREIKKDFEEKKISEDEKFGQEKKLQEITDEFVEKIDKAGENKERELLQV